MNRSVRAALRRGSLLGILTPLLSLAVLAIPVNAERNASGTLIAFLDGGISPRTLPRTHRAPVAVRIHGGIHTTKGIPLPRVEEVRLELAYRGVLDTDGLPLCPRVDLRAADI